MASTPAQIVNQALIDSGRNRRVADLYDGSEEAIIAIELYSQTRDELLRANDWSFSRGVKALTLLKGPPPDGGYSLSQPWTAIYPTPGFLYEYTYPSDCLDLRSIIQPPGPMPDLDPVPALWRIDNDLTPVVSGSTAIGPPAKVILCNMTNAVAVYRRQVTDPTLWEAGFTATLVAALAKKFAKAFQENPNVVRDQEGTEVAVKGVASNVRG